MIILPAIDLMGGKVVRLERGDYGKVKSYSLDPEDVADSFYREGARYLHVVDLDGARSGKCDNATTISKIISSCNLSVEVGGGIRSERQIEKYLDAGAQKIILGTAAIKDNSFLQSAIKKYSQKIAVGVDAKSGKVAIDGWLETTDIDAIDFCKHLKETGVENVIFTDISRDGMLKGTNLEIYKVLCQTYMPKITASGGISTINEISILKQIGAYGAIIGKALYEGVINLKEAVEAAK